MVGKEELLGPRGGVCNRDYNNYTGSHMDHNSYDSNNDSLFSNVNFEGELHDNIMVEEEEQVAKRGGGDDGDYDDDNNSGRNDNKNVNLEGELYDNIMVDKED